MCTLVFILNFNPLLIENKCTIYTFPEFLIMYTLVSKLKNKVQFNTLNFFEHVLFLLTIDRIVGLYIQKNSRADLHVFKIV